MNCIKSHSKSINYGAKFKWENFLSGKKNEFLKLGIWFQFYASSNKRTFFGHPVVFLLFSNKSVAFFGTPSMVASMYENKTERSNTQLDTRKHYLGDSKSWESPEREDNVYRLFIQILFP